MKNTIKAVVIAAALLAPVASFAAVDVNGCTNSRAKNFDPAATVDDGSCRFPHARHKQITVTTDDKGNRTVFEVDHFECNELGCHAVAKK